MDVIIKFLFALVLIGLSWGGEVLVYIAIEVMMDNSASIPFIIKIISWMVTIAIGILLALPTYYAAKTVCEFFSDIYKEYKAKH